MNKMLKYGQLSTFQGKSLDFRTAEAGASAEPSYALFVRYAQRGEKLQEAAKSTDYTVDLTETKGGSLNTQDNRLNIIYWNPNQGLETGKGTLSPATILEHETDHAVENETNYYKQLENKRESDRHFENKEEKRVITGSEYKTGLANGELKPVPKGKSKLESSYRSHMGKNTYVPVISPISNKKTRK